MSKITSIKKHLLYGLIVVIRDFLKSYFLYEDPKISNKVLHAIRFDSGWSDPINGISRAPPLTLLSDGGKQGEARESHDFGQNGAKQGGKREGEAREIPLISSVRFLPLRRLGALSRSAVCKMLGMLIQS